MKFRSRRELPSIGLTSASASCGHDLVNVGYQKQAHQYDSAMTPLSPSSLAQRRGLSSSRACGDEPRCGLEHVCIAAEVIERRLCVDDQAFQTPSRGGGSQYADECCLVGGRVLARCFADRCWIAFHIEKIVRDLERLAQRRTVALECRPLDLIRLAQNRTGNARESQQCARFHRL